jgi:hypothetical protein
LTRLDISDNRIDDIDGENNTSSSRSAVLAIIRSSSALLDLNISGNRCNFRYDASLPDAIAKLSKLRTFTFDGGEENSKPVCMGADTGACRLTGKHLHTWGARLVAQFLPKCR